MYACRLCYDREIPADLRTAYLLLREGFEECKVPSSEQCDELRRAFDLPNVYEERWGHAK